MAKAKKRSRTKIGKLPRFLAEPITMKRYRRTLVGLTADEAKQKNAGEAARVANLLRDKLESLFSYFSIPRTRNEAADYRALALALAVEHFSGFQVNPPEARRRGRPSENTTVLLMGLLIDVEEKKRSMRAAGSPVSDAKALGALTKDPRFRARWSRYKPRRLANLLAQAHNPALNPLYKVWKRGDQARKIAREAIVTAITVSRKTTA
jgi:hypothetical protein